MGFPVVVSAVAFLIGVLVALTVVWMLSTGSPRHDEVLPSHYSSLLQFDHTRYPGHCTECGTDNEPGFRFCEECGSTIPTVDGSPSDADIGSILEG